MLTQEQVLEKIDKGESFERDQIGLVDFTGQSFRKHVNFSDAIFTSSANFENVKFEKGVSFCNVVFKHGVGFVNAKFRGETDFDYTEYENNATFKNAEFLKKVSFVESKFNNQVTFWKAEFKGKVDFEKAEFKYGFSFLQAKSINDVSFKNAKFKGWTYFNFAEFQKEADFGNVEFDSEVKFFASKFLGDVDFTDTKFNKNVYFILTSFNKNVIFYGSVFNVLADFDRTKFNEVDFRNTYFGGLTRFTGKRIKREHNEIKEKWIIKQDQLIFPRDQKVDLRDVTFGEPERVVFRTVDMSRCLLLNTDLTKVEFADVQWGKYKNRSIIYDEMYQDEHEEKNYALIEKVYSQLKKNLEDSRNYAEVGDFHYGEMEMRRKRHWGIFKHISFTSFYKYFSGYGEKYWWAIGVLAFFILLFTFIYWCMGLDIINAFIHTLQVAFLQSNLKDKLVSNWGILVEFLERLIIIIQVTLVVLTFRRKFRR